MFHFPDICPRIVTSCSFSEFLLCFAIGAEFICLLLFVTLRLPQRRPLGALLAHSVHCRAASSIGVPLSKGVILQDLSLPRRKPLQDIFSIVSLQEGWFLEKPVTLQSQGEQMVGMLHLPEGKGPFPGVAIFHGFTGTKVEPHRIFVKMARALVDQGIAAVRFDFRGSGDSEGDFADMTVSGEIVDGIRVLDFLQEEPLVDGTRLGVVGLSMGGAVAASVAGKDERVKSLVLWAAVAQFGLFEKEEELLRQARELGYADLGGNVLNYSFYEDARTQDPLKWAAKYKGPALIIHGDEDPTVPIAHADLYENAFTGTKEKFIVPGADHTFNRRDWEAKVIGKTAEWLRNTL